MRETRRVEKDLPSGTRAPLSQPWRLLESQVVSSPLNLTFKHLDHRPFSPISPSAYLIWPPKIMTLNENPKSIYKHILFMNTSGIGAECWITPLKGSPRNALCATPKGHTPTPPSPTSATPTLWISSKEVGSFDGQLQSPSPRKCSCLNDRLSQRVL